MNSSGRCSGRWVQQAHLLARHVLQPLPALAQGTSTPGRRGHAVPRLTVNPPSPCGHHLPELLAALAAAVPPLKGASKDDRPPSDDRNTPMTTQHASKPSQCLTPLQQTTRPRQQTTCSVGHPGCTAPLPAVLCGRMHAYRGEGLVCAGQRLKPPYGVKIAGSGPGGRGRRVSWPLPPRIFLKLPSKHYQQTSALPQQISGVRQQTSTRGG